jgi:hypothetical protein
VSLEAVVLAMATRQPDATEDLLRLMRRQIAATGLDLRGMTVLTEAATGAYATTPVIAALAGAARVWAFTRGSRHGSVAEVRAGTLALAEAAGVSGPITVIEELSPRILGMTDIVTNSGHLRPLDAAMIEHLPQRAVIGLMFEGWEFRTDDIDRAACARRGIPIVGVNERHPAVGVFAFLGPLCVQLLRDAGLSADGRRVAVLCDNPFAPFLADGLAAAGASAELFDSAHAVPPGPWDAVVVRARTAPIWPNCCWPRAIRVTASSAARRRSTPARIDHLYEDPHEQGRTPFLHYGDMTDSTNLIRSCRRSSRRDLQSRRAEPCAVSFETPEYTANADALGVLRLLEAIRILGMEKTRFYQASTSELYGLVQEMPQKETTPFYPRSPYAVAKLYAYWITVNYREAYGMYASNGILFNHESPIRGETFVTRKITRASPRIETRAAGHALSRQSRRQARLGPCARLCRGHVADAAAGRARRLCAGHRRDPLGARIRRAGLRRVGRTSNGAARRRREGLDKKTGKCWSRSIRAISARPRSICCSATRPRRAARPERCSSRRPRSAASSPTTYPGDFLYDNLMIEANIIEAAHRSRRREAAVPRLVLHLPAFAPQPITEDALLTGPLEPTNEWYAVAKIAGIKLCQAYRRPAWLRFISAMPTNLYGPATISTWRATSCRP